MNSSKIPFITFVYQRQYVNTRETVQFQLNNEKYSLFRASFHCYCSGVKHVFVEWDLTH